MRQGEQKLSEKLRLEGGPTDLDGISLIFRSVFDEENSIFYIRGEIGI